MNKLVTFFSVCFYAQAFIFKKHRSSMQIGTIKFKGYSRTAYNEVAISILPQS